tara:strand:- start:3585 stop:3818 length:234 start_codon:yes stop_codon:yes gene_type:complete
MLGILLYEAVDIVYNVSRIGYNTVWGTYAWYIGVPVETDTTRDTKIKELEDKLSELSDLFKDGNLKKKVEMLRLKNH